MARHWKERYPGVDIVLIEPDPDDELMFQTNILNFASRVDVARHGFQSVTLKLANGLRRAARGLRAATASRSPPRACARSCATSPPRREKTRAWRRILEQTTGALLRQSAGDCLTRPPGEPSVARRALERVRVLLVDDVALDLQRRRQLARLLGEVVVEDEELLICSTRA